MDIKKREKLIYVIYYLSIFSMILFLFYLLRI